MGLPRTAFEINDDFSRKSLKKIPTRVFCAPAEGVPLRIGYRHWGSNKLYDGATGPRKKFDDILGRVAIHALT